MEEKTPIEQEKAKVDTLGEVIPNPNQEQGGISEKQVKNASNVKKKLKKIWVGFLMVSFGIF